MSYGQIMIYKSTKSGYECKTIWQRNVLKTAGVPTSDYQNFPVGVTERLSDNICDKN